MQSIHVHMPLCRHPWAPIKASHLFIVGPVRRLCISGAIAFFDFRNMVDEKKRDWFENSRQASLAAQQFAMDSS